MPEPQVPGAGGPPPGASPPGGAPQPQAPFGSSPATAPTANRGLEMAGLQKLGVLVNSLGELLPMLGASSPAGQDLLDVLKKLAKHVPPGTSPPAQAGNQIQKMATQNAQSGQAMAALKNQQAQQGGGGPSPAPAAAA